MAALPAEDLLQAVTIDKSTAPDQHARADNCLCYGIAIAESLFFDHRPGRDRDRLRQPSRIAERLIRNCDVFRQYKAVRYFTVFERPLSDPGDAGGDDQVLRLLPPEGRCPDLGHRIAVDFRRDLDFPVTSIVFHNGGRTIMD